MKTFYTRTLLIVTFSLSVLTACGKSPTEILSEYSGNYFARSIDTNQHDPIIVKVDGANPLEIIFYESVHMLGNFKGVDARIIPKLDNDSKTSDIVSFIVTNESGKIITKDTILTLSPNSDDSSKLVLTIKNTNYESILLLEKLTSEDEKRFNLTTDKLVKTLKESYSDDLIEMQMVKIPSGDFQMGCIETVDFTCESDEKPIHKVSIPEFEIGKFEITFEQWDACVAMKGCELYPFDNDWGRGKRPVFNLTRYDIQQYIKWLNKKTGKNYRLPSEAEWEYAARAGSKTAFPWGNKLVYDNLNSLQAFGGWKSQKAKVAPVGSYPPNAYGVYDMISNVSELTQDCWKENYNGVPIDGTAWKPDNCKNYVTRGGDIQEFPSKFRVSARNKEWRTNYTSFLGFRLARDID